MIDSYLHLKQYLNRKLVIVFFFKGNDLLLSRLFRTFELCLSLIKHFIALTDHLFPSCYDSNFGCFYCHLLKCFALCICFSSENLHFFEIGQFKEVWYFEKAGFEIGWLVDLSCLVRLLSTGTESGFLYGYAQEIRRDHFIILDLSSVIFCLLKVFYSNIEELYRFCFLIIGWVFVLKFFGYFKFCLKIDF